MLHIFHQLIPIPWSAPNSLNSVVVNTFLVTTVPLTASWCTLGKCFAPLLVDVSLFCPWDLVENSKTLQSEIKLIGSFSSEYYEYKIWLRVRKSFSFPFKCCFSSKQTTRETKPHAG
jgi:hypothetical protein